MSTRTSQRTFRNLIVIGVAVALMCGAAIAGCKPRSMREAQTVYGLVNPGTLTVACDFASPPMNFYDNSGAPRGFEYELLQTVADRLGLKVKYIEDTSVKDIPAALNEHKADMGASAIVVSDVGTVSDGVIIGRPYMAVGRDLIIARDAERTDLDDYNDPSVTIAVDAESASENWVRNRLPKAQIAQVKTADEGLMGVTEGTYSAAVYDDVTASYLLSGTYTNLMVANHVHNAGQYCFVYPEGSATLRDDIDQVMQDLESEGYIDSLETKWFGSVLD